MAALPSRDKVNFRLPWTNSCISAKLSRSKLHVHSHSVDGCLLMPGAWSGSAPHGNDFRQPASSRIGNDLPVDALPAFDHSAPGFAEISGELDDAIGRAFGRA